MDVETLSLHALVHRWLQKASYNVARRGSGVAGECTSNHESVQVRPLACAGEAGPVLCTWVVE